MIPPSLRLIPCHQCAALREVRTLKIISIAHRRHVTFAQLKVPNPSTLPSRLWRLRAARPPSPRRTAGPRRRIFSPECHDRVQPSAAAPAAWLQPHQPIMDSTKRIEAILNVVIDDRGIRYLIKWSGDHLPVPPAQAGCNRESGENSATHQWVLGTPRLLLAENMRQPLIFVSS
jgi:hypothetical protein